ncbi:DinB family protein [Sulfitobacter sp. D35]|uniref:DinB family protein n=1 Tax=Sulfitobacter sp. D35 TaxID=3083252 RepID=UPI00296FBFBE|nr:DinB family protein [Sulfitobacter sp. D35]MDW4496687.1 DinB family protein [Sulfitobacter sp. D35]
MTDTAHPYLMMARNNAWANETLYDALIRLPETAFCGPRPGFFPSLRVTMAHILTVDRYYLAALEGTPTPYAEIETPETRGAGTLAAAQAVEDARFVALCRDLDATTLGQSRETPRDAGARWERVDDLLLHLFQHQVHHRGQAHVQLQHAGVAPPQLDDFYLDYGRVPTAQRWRDR